jgi:hypothetical protein
MTAETAEMLTRIIGGQNELKAEQAHIASALTAQSQVQWLISEQPGIVIEKLTPELGNGPTMQELLVELVVRVGDNGALLRERHDLARHRRSGGRAALGEAGGRCSPPAGAGGPGPRFLPLLQGFRAR